MKHDVKNAAQYAEEVQKVIVKDLLGGVIPFAVGSYAELYDHVDANTYLEDYVDWDVEGDARFVVPNAIIAKVDEWLTKGEHRVYLVEYNKLQVADAVADVKNWILADIQGGKVPASVASFADLGTHVDSNTYLENFIDYDAEGEAQNLIPNQVIPVIDAWLKEGEHRVA